MFGAMALQAGPGFLHGNAILLTRLVSAIKFSAEEISESGDRKSKPIYAGSVILGHPLTFHADRCCCSSHGHAYARWVLNQSQESFQGVSPVCVRVGEPIAYGVESNGYAASDRVTPRGLGFQEQILRASRYHGLINLLKCPSEYSARIATKIVS